MKIGKPDDDKILISIKVASRNKDGRMEYETVETITVYEATQQEVIAACNAGLESAARKAK